MRGENPPAPHIMMDGVIDECSAACLKLACHNGR